MTHTSSNLNSVNLERLNLDAFITDGHYPGCLMGDDHSHSYGRRVD